MSRMRSPVTSRSNWAKESSTLRVSRPIEVVVLNCWVTETNETLMRFEQLDQLGEVGKRPGQAIDLVDHHDVDLAGLDVGQQPLQRRPLHGAAGEAAVVVAALTQSPALVSLAFDVGLAGFALGVERVELLLQALLGGLAGVDRAAKNLTFVRCHHALPMSSASGRAARRSAARSRSFP